MKSPSGSCQTDVLAKSFPESSVTNFTGDVLGGCKDFTASSISQVIFKHQGSDAWGGQYLKIHLQNGETFICTLGIKIDEQDGNYPNEASFSCNKLGKTKQPENLNLCHFYMVFNIY